MAEKLNDKDKKLVWSLDDALRKRKELGKEGEVDLEKDLKIKQVDSQKDVLVYEYEVQKSPIEKLKSSSYCKIAKWVLVIVCILAAAGIIGAIVALALKATSPQTYATGIGSTCNDTLPCDPTKGQICTNGICNCSSTTPAVLTDSDTCVAVEDYLGECTDPQQCDSSKGLACINSICVCDNVTLGYSFWSTKSQKCVKCSPASSATTSGATYKYSTTISSCYGVSGNTATGWSNAKAICQSEGGDLFSASSQKKFEFLSSILLVNSNYWIGGSYNPITAWTWNDGTAISTSWSGWCSGASTNGVYPSIAATYTNGTTACINSVTDVTGGYSYVCEIS